MALQDLTPQLRTRLSRVERLVGLFVFLSVALLVTGLAFYVRHQLKERGYGLKKIPYYTYVSDSTGLKVGTPVKMMGFTIGEITLVDRGPDDWWMVQSNLNVVVKFIVREPYFNYIWLDSHVKLGSGDFLGTRSLEVTRGRGYELTVGNWRGKEAWVASDDWATDRFLGYNSIPLVYHRLSEKTNGFFLVTDENPPLPDKLGQIAQTVDAALPGVLAMTNKLDTVLSNLVTITSQFEKTMPQVKSAVGEAEKLLADLQPLTQKPGGIGELLLPTNLNSQLTVVLEDVHKNSDRLGPLVTNISDAVSDMRNTMITVQNTVSNLQAQLTANTNLAPAVTQVAEKTAQLAETTDTLLRRHWLFRSAFKTNKADKPKR